MLMGLPRFRRHLLKQDLQLRSGLSQAWAENAVVRSVASILLCAFHLGQLLSS